MIDCLKSGKRYQMVSVVANQLHQPLNAFSGYHFLPTQQAKVDVWLHNSFSLNLEDLHPNSLHCIHDTFPTI